MLFSRAILRTNGDSGPAVSSTTVATGSLDPSASATGEGEGAAGAAAGVGGAGGSDCRVSGAAAGAAAGAPAPSLIRATTVLIPTVLPSSIRTSASTPATGDGISVSTLSVEISNRGSSRPTVSPGFFSHLVSVPSTILSPIWGITTSIIRSPFAGQTRVQNSL